MKKILLILCFLLIASPVYAVMTQAICDGETNDTSIIQQEINNATVNEDSTVTLPANKYCRIIQLYMKQGVTLSGMGKDRSFIVSQALIPMIIINEPYVTIKGIKLIGIARTYNVTGIRIEGIESLTASHIKIEDVAMERMQFGIRFIDYCDSNTLSDVFIVNTELGISIEKRANAIELNKVFISNSTNGIQIAAQGQCTGIVIRNGAIQEITGNHGIYIGNYAQGVTIDGVYFEGNYPLDISIASNAFGVVVQNSSIIINPISQDSVRCNSNNATIQNNSFLQIPTFAVINLTSNSRNCKVLYNKFRDATNKYNDSGINNAIID